MLNYEIVTEYITPSQESSFMDKITVNKQELILVLKENKETHRKTFLEAQEGYREEVIKVLDKTLKDARDGKNVNTYISLPKPEDHTEDYTTSIEMLKWCVEEEIAITRQNYENFVMDKWNWTTTFAQSTGMYCKK